MTTAGDGRRGARRVRHAPSGRRPLWLRPAAAAFLAAAVLALGAACGGSSGGSSGGGTSQGGGSTETYTNSDSRCSNTYDTVLTQGDAAGGGDAGAVFSIAFVDTGAPRAGKAYTDGVKVSVFKLARTVTADEVPGLRQQVHDTVDEHLTKLESGEVVEPVKPTTVNGTPGFTVSYSFTRDGAAVSATTDFLFSGDYQYEVTGQARKAAWAKMQPVVESAMASFTVD